MASSTKFEHTLCHLCGFSPTFVTNYTWFSDVFITNHMQMHSGYFVCIYSTESACAWSMFSITSYTLDHFTIFKTKVWVNNAHRAERSTKFVLIWQISVLLNLKLTEQEVGTAIRSWYNLPFSNPYPKAKSLVAQQHLGISSEINQYYVAIMKPHMFYT